MKRLDKFNNFVNELKKEKKEKSVIEEIQEEAIKVASMMFDKTGSISFTYDIEGLPNSIEFTATDVDWKLDYDEEEMKLDYSEGVMRKRRYQVSLFFAEKLPNNRIKFNIQLTPTTDIKYAEKADYWIVWQFDSEPTDVLEYLEGDPDEGFRNYFDSDGVDYSDGILRIKNSLYKTMDRDELDMLIDEEGGIKVEKEPI